MPEPEVKPVVTETVATPPAPEAETVKGEPFDAARAMKTIEALRAEIKELKPKAKQADDLTLAEQKRREAEMTELQKMQTQFDTAKAELKALKLIEMRRAAAAKVELPLVFADRLVGETPEQLEEDAKKLLAALPKAPKPPVLNATNPGAGATQGETEAQALARIHGQSVNVLDPNFARNHGGGVLIRDKPLTPPE
jgi:FtsZ-binding cell division protein ZapB